MALTSPRAQTCCYLYVCNCEIAIELFFGPLLAGRGYPGIVLGGEKASDLSESLRSAVSADVLRRVEFCCNERKGNAVANRWRPTK